MSLLDILAIIFLIISIVGLLYLWKSGLWKWIIGTPKEEEAYDEQYKRAKDIMKPTEEKEEEKLTIITKPSKATGKTEKIKEEEEKGEKAKTWPAIQPLRENPKATRRLLKHSSISPEELREIPAGDEWIEAARAVGVITGSVEVDGAEEYIVDRSGVKELVETLTDEEYTFPEAEGQVEEVERIRISPETTRKLVEAGFRALGVIHIGDVGPVLKLAMGWSKNFERLLEREIPPKVVSAMDIEAAGEEVGMVKLDRKIIGVKKAAHDETSFLVAELPGPELGVETERAYRRLKEMAKAYSGIPTKSFFIEAVNSVLDLEIEVKEENEEEAKKEAEDEEIPYEGVERELRWLKEKEAVSREESEVEPKDLTERIQEEHGVPKWKANEMRRKLVEAGYIKQEKSGKVGYTVFLTDEVLEALKRAEGTD